MSYMATLQASRSSHPSAAQMMMGKKAAISTNVESWTVHFFLIFHLTISDDCIS